MLLGERAVPRCPLCEGPCEHPFPRSPFAFPDRLPKAPMHRASRDPDPKPERPKGKPRGKRRKPDRDRMIHGPERTTAVEGPIAEREQ